MKRILLIAALMILILPLGVRAVTLGGLDETAREANIASSPSPEGIAGGLVSQILSLVGILFLILMIYAGTMWMTAAGNEERINKAKQILVGSLIGLIIVLSAYAITRFVGDSLLNSN